MRIADGVEMLEIPANLMNGTGFVCPTLLWDENQAVLIDAGFPFQTELFREAIASAGVTFEHISSVILTHSDTDHIGCLSGILKAIPHKVAVMAHEKEKPYIEALLPPIRIKQMEEQAQNLRPELREDMMRRVESYKSNYKKMRADVDVSFAGDSALPVCGGIAIIETPGHTPGHISVYHRPSKTLIAGDMLSVEGGKLVRSPAGFCLDKKKYEESLKKLTEYDIKAVICYHGGLFKRGSNRRIAELAAGNFA